MAVARQSQADRFAGLQRLLAILIRSGRTGESALQAGEKVAARYAERLDRLTEAGRGEFNSADLSRRCSTESKQR
jgi:hypothetical protein